jgi:hypothetical protein
MESNALASLRKTEVLLADFITFDDSISEANDSGRTLDHAFIMGDKNKSLTLSVMSDYSTSLRIDLAVGGSLVSRSRALSLRMASKNPGRLACRGFG